MRSGAEHSAPDAPDWIRTSTPKKAQALNLPRMPIPPPGLDRYYTPLVSLVNPGQAGYNAVMRIVVGINVFQPVDYNQPTNQLTN